MLLNKHPVSKVGTYQIPNPRQFGLSIRAHRIGRGLNQSEFAVEVGLSQGALSKLERGRAKSVTQKTLLLLSQVSGLTPADLLAGELGPDTRLSPSEHSEFVSVLKDALQNSKLYLFLGPQLSANQSVSQPEILERMGRMLREAGKNLIKPFDSLRSRGKIAEAIGYYNKSPVQDSKKQNLFNDLFLHGSSPGPVHLRLAQLNSSGVFTVNVDHLFEDAYAVAKGRSLTSLDLVNLAGKDLLRTDSFFVVKLRGDTSNWRNIILAEDDPSFEPSLRRMCEIMRGKGLLALGFDPDDTLLHKALAFSADMQVFVVLSKKPSEASTRALMESEHVRTIVLEDNNLAGLLDEIRPVGVAAPRVYDSPWGTMPLEDTPLDFPDATSQLREFLFSKRNEAVVVAPEGSGLSSFLAARVDEYSHLPKTTVYRLEGKEWLPLEGYTLYVIGHLPPEAYSFYCTMRRSEAGGWTDQKEAKAVAEAFSSSGFCNIIFIDLADRLSPDSLEFWRAFVAAASPSTKLILGATEPIGLSEDMLTISLGKPSSESLHRVLTRRCSPKMARAILQAIPDADLNKMILSACLLNSGVMSRKNIENNLDLYDVKDLCEKAVDALRKQGTGLDLIELLKACVVFRTPRKSEWIAYCSRRDDTEELKRGLQGACRLGLLIKRTYIRGQEAYCMSTTIRNALDEILFRSEPLSRAQLSKRAAEVFKGLSIDKLRAKEATRPEIVRAVPLICCAIYHAIEANDVDGYVELVTRAGEYLHRMYHLGVLEKWLRVPLVTRDPGDLRADTEFDVQYMRARIARVKADPGVYGEHLNLARTALLRIKKHDAVYVRRYNKLGFEEGIFQSMKRNYRKAYEVFKRLYDNTAQSDPDRFLNAIERLVQTHLSLGRFDEAENKLVELRRCLTEQLSLRFRKPLHHWSMYHRHLSTLCIVRLLAYQFKPKDHPITRERLLEYALEESAECRRCSEQVGYSPRRFAVPDETGIGITRLKEAQVYYAVFKFADALKSAELAAVILTNYPNNRWWRMSCHDVAARSAAWLGELKLAEEHLKQAKDIFESSCKADILRGCELKRTEGLIALQNMEIERAVLCLKQSVGFVNHDISSPCIELVHRIDLIRALLMGRQLESAAQEVEKAKAVDIHW